MKSQRKISFLMLTAFSSTGGIEKFNKALMKALVELQERHRYTVSFAAMHDRGVDTDYVPARNFQPFFGKRIRFVLFTFLQSLRCDHLMIGHLNLAVVGVLFKLFRPGKKLTVICHGLEVFEPVSGLKKQLLQKADHILAVSAFTKKKLIDLQGVPAERISIFPNTLDPGFQLPAVFSKPAFLKNRYGIEEREWVIFTLTRLNSNEGYKGYDKVISVLPHLIKKGIPCKYILAGKADAVEERRIRDLIAANNMQEYVICTGFLANEEITDHYLLADVFVMPSKGEGFGIVYLEAMACGLPVIAGNKDGSVDALKQGELGTLVNPDSLDEIEQAITNQYGHQPKKQALQQALLQEFGFEQYKKRVEDFLQL